VWNWGSFTQAWNSFLPKLRNSLLLGVTATLLFMLMLFGMFIPYQSILIPMFRFIKSIGLYGTVWGLVVVHTVYGLPITTLIFRNYYVEVPDALVEATSIDGAGFFGIYRYVMFPLSMPGFVVVIIWQFTQIWNEFLFAVTLSKPASQPITVALALLAALPTLIVYVVFGRYFIRGLLAGSIKG